MVDLTSIWTKDISKSRDNEHGKQSITPKLPLTKHVGDHIGRYRNVGGREYVEKCKT